MNTSKLLIGRKGSLLWAIIGATLAGCTTYVQRETVYREQSPPPEPPPPTAPAQPAQVEVVIHTENDFDEPLRPYGHWETVGTYGRCWVPARVEPDWRPYCNGHWEETEDGWYWVSDEPWGWATYHYGRWDFDARIGWFWVPQTQWAPAWVCWRRGDGYVGWAPLPPAARFERDTVVVEDRVVRPRYVFVEERRFLEPVRPRTVVVNNTTIINKTVNITNVRVVNKTIINEGPRRDVIEKASGRQVRPVQVRELRRKAEAQVAAKVNGKAPVPDQNNAQNRREQEAQRKAQMEQERQAKELERQRQAEAQKQKQIEAQKAAQEKQAQMEADRRARQLEQQKQIEAQKAAREKQAQVDAQRREQEAHKKAQTEADRRANELEKKAQVDAQRRERQQQAQMEQQQREAAAKEKAQRAADERTKTREAAKAKADQKKAARKSGKEQQQEKSQEAQKNAPQ